jgi:predicted alpha/beta superfamily hydrolase
MRLLVLLCLVAAACSDPPAEPDGGAVDAGTMPVDASPSDGGSASDGGTGDAATPDGGGEVVTTIRIVYPEGATLAIRGSGGPLSWDVGLATTAMPGGLYELRTTEITEPLEWKPLLDDATWARGPNHHVEPGETVEVAPHFAETTGQVVELLSAWSPSALGNTRVVWAYLPASYDENEVARYPVVYMHDGQNLFDPALAFGGNEWQVDETMDAAAESGRCADMSPCTNDGECGGARCDTFREAIVIGIANTASRIDEYTPTVDAGLGAGGRADDYLGALIDDLAPTVNAMLRTRTGPEDTAIVGSSLGGLVSAHGGIERPDVFGLVGAMSPSTWWDGRVILDEVASIPMRTSRARRVYVDSGDSGPSGDGATDTAELARAYRDAGYVEGTDFHHLLAPGHEHNEIYWRQRLPGALSFLLGPRDLP